MLLCRKIYENLCAKITKQTPAHKKFFMMMEIFKRIKKCEKKRLTFFAEFDIIIDNHSVR